MASELEAKVRRALWSMGDKPRTSVYERQINFNCIEANGV